MGISLVRNNEFIVPSHEVASAANLFSFNEGQLFVET